MAMSSCKTRDIIPQAMFLELHPLLPSLNAVLLFKDVVIAIKRHNVTALPQYESWQNLAINTVFEYLIYLFENHIFFDTVRNLT